MATEFTACILYNDAHAPDGLEKYEFDRVMTQRDDLQKRLQRLQGHLSIARVRNWDGQPSSPMQLEILRNPQFEPARSREVSGNFMPITLREFNQSIAVVLDRYSEQSGNPKPDISVPKVNEAAVQAYGKDKYRACVDLLQPLDLSIPTALPNEAQNLVRQFGSQSAYFAKLRRGGFGRGVERFNSAAELLAWAEQLDSTDFEHYIIQPAYDFTHPIPGLRPFSPTDQASINANQLPIPKEVRVYCFVRNGRCQEQLALPRTSQLASERSYVGIESTWMWADPQSVPAKLYELAARVVERVAAITGVSALYGAIDFGYGATHASHTPHWVVIESNLDFPGIRTPRQHPIIGALVSDMLARHIAAVARG